MGCVVEDRSLLLLRQFLGYSAGGTDKHVLPRPDDRGDLGSGSAQVLVQAVFSDRIAAGTVQVKGGQGTHGHMAGQIFHGRSLGVRRALIKGKLWFGVSRRDGY